MDRRDYLAGVTIGMAGIAGCLDITGIFPNSQNVSGEDTGRNSPVFEANEDDPGMFILLRQQPQDPNGIVVGDSFEIGLVLGNAGGEPVTGDVSVELNPPNDDEATQTATVVVDDKIPSGTANMFIAGPFDATIAGDWALIAGPEIERVSPEYDEKVSIENHSDK